MLTDVVLVARSGNSKTGTMPVTYRTMNTCPTSCPFLPANSGGCYGSGRIFDIARRRAGNLTEDEAVAKLGSAERSARYLRDRVVGDLVNAAGKFDRAYALAIARIAKRTGLIAFGYTHAWSKATRADISAIAKAGYVLNASCESEAQVSRAVSLGMPVVITGDQWEEGSFMAGKRVVTCPNQTRGVTCADCGLCAKPDRACVIRFQVHGPARRRAEASIAQHLQAA